jgi:hypothetical protein
VADALRIRLWLIAAIGLIAAALLAAGGLPAAEGGSKERDRPSAKKVWPPVNFPSQRAIRRAQEFAAARGEVSFALISSSAGRYGYDVDRQYSSASASKALLLAAQLRQLQKDNAQLDAASRALLEPMIVYSDNGAASGVYARVGDAGLYDVAQRAGMRGFSVDPGFWGGAQITAADMVQFYFRLERNLGRRYRDYGLRLLSSISPTQRWGIPAAAGRRWRVWFKGGWRPAGQKGTTGPVTHQAALLVHRRGERLALAVLSNEAPGSGAGFDAIEGVAERLLAEPPPRRGGWLAP